MINDNKQQKLSDSTDTAIAYSTCYAQPLFSRVWAMPNKLTFTIKPIKELVEKHVAKSKIIIDPFANQSSYGTITNDLNPEFDTDYHLDALTFLRKMETGKADLVLFDPPYSITQAAQCYKDYGKDKLERSVANMGYWADCKNEVARILKPNGIAFICGWNSNGIGKNRGFEMLEILLVPHGGSKNDTIVTVERKLPDLFSLVVHNGVGMVLVFGGLITTKLNNMCTKEQIQEAKKYLGEQGYGTGSNFTVNAVANLMAEWLAKNCNIPVVSGALPDEEEIRTPIQDALYATRHFLTDECTELADGILLYLKDAGFKIVRQ